MTVDSVFEHGREIIALQRLAAGGSLALECVDETADLLRASRASAVVVASSLSLGDMTLAFYGVADVITAGTESLDVAIYNFRFRSLRQIRTELEEFNQFVDAASCREGISTILYMRTGVAQELLGP